MHAEQLDAFIIPRADEYLGEYVPPHNERLHWISNFTGSAGVVIVLKEQAAIFVDGRYTVQVKQQVESELFDYLHLIDNPQLDWLCEQLPSGAKVGCDPRTHTLRWYKNAQSKLAKADISLVGVTHNPVDQNWQDRPQPEQRSILLLDEALCGQSSLAKRQQIGEKIAQAGADAAIITALDSIAWLLNIRGQDILRLPVVLSSAVLYANGEMNWYLDTEKLVNGWQQHVGEGVRTYPEADFADALPLLGEECDAIMADPDTANAWCQLTVEAAGAKLIASADPCLLPKAAKNATEIAGMHKAHHHDALAEVKFLSWLDTEVAQGSLHTEDVLADKLEQFRRQDPDLLDLSFDTISAAAGNAAMCHYNHNNGTPAQLENNSLYLVDSGGQYRFGTTDITRTVAIGEVSQTIKQHFTLVLKGMITLSLQTFPKGTNGAQLDAIARQFLWNAGLDYDHGTGHGVGHFLSVHEGPQRIGKGVSDVALLPGMVLSNEPGFYKEGEYGIRCENLVVVTERSLPNSDRTYYGFDNLTWVPFDRRLVDVALLSDSELAWLNQYHQQVFDKISGELEGDTLMWLTQATAPLSR